MLRVNPRGHHVSRRKFRENASELSIHSWPCPGSPTDQRIDAKRFLTLPLVISILPMHPTSKFVLGLKSNALFVLCWTRQEPFAIEDDELVRIACRGLFFQAEDQAKSAMKGGSNLIAPTSAVSHFTFLRLCKCKNPKKVRKQQVKKPRCPTRKSGLLF